MKTILIVLFLGLVLSGCADSSRPIIIQDSCVRIGQIEILSEQTGTSESTSATPDMDANVEGLPLNF